MPYKTLDDVDVAGKRVLLRLDLNVPVHDGKVTDATRIERAVPTIAELRKKGAKVIVLSHFGRPKDGPDEANSLRQVRDALSEAIARPVAFARDCIGPLADVAVDNMHPGDVLLLENTRFRKAEEANDPDFVRALASYGDLYVNDAFSCAHRAHASTEGLAHVLPAFAGRAMQAELEALTRALGTPARPLVAIVGGAKISTKLAVLEHLLDKVDTLIIGGAMANTFLLALGFSLGASLVEPDLVEKAQAVLAKAKTLAKEIVLPVDGVVAHDLKAGVPTRTVGVDAIGADDRLLDIGPRSVAGVIAALRKAKTLVWNGPLGAFETPPFDAATNTVAKEVAALTRMGGLVSVAGGGDTVSCLHHAGVADALSYVSTAGGAFLEWLEGRALPGVDVLRK